MKPALGQRSSPSLLQGSSNQVICQGDEGGAASFLLPVNGKMRNFLGGIAIDLPLYQTEDGQMKKLCGGRYYKRGHTIIDYPQVPGKFLIADMFLIYWMAHENVHIVDGEMEGDIRKEVFDCLLPEPPGQTLSLIGAQYWRPWLK